MHFLLERLCLLYLFELCELTNFPHLSLHPPLGPLSSLTPLRTVPFLFLSSSFSPSSLFCTPELSLCLPLILLFLLLPPSSPVSLHFQTFEDCQHWHHKVITGNVQFIFRQLDMAVLTQMFSKQFRVEGVMKMKWPAIAKAIQFLYPPESHGQTVRYEHSVVMVCTFSKPCAIIQPQRTTIERGRSLFSIKCRWIGGSGPQYVDITLNSEDIGYLKIHDVSMTFLETDANEVINQLVCAF